MIRPILTDKSTRLMEMRQYTFSVSPRMRKAQIKSQIEQMFQVKVLAVRKSRPQRMIVKLAESIDLLSYGSEKSD
nr:ribosomal protein L23 [Cyanidioschyzonaceae sp. 1]